MKNNNKINIDNKTIYKTSYYPVLEKREDDKYLKIIGSTRLDSLALRYYKDEHLWWVIAVANNLDIDNYILKADTILRMPDLNYVKEYIKNFQNEQV